LAAKKSLQEKFWKEIDKGSLKNVKKYYDEAGEGSPIVNYQDFGKTGMTSLMMAAAKGHDKIVKYLLEIGAADGIGKIDKEDWTALMHAVNAREFAIATTILGKCKKEACKACQFSKSGLSATLLLAKHFKERGADKLFKRLGGLCAEQLSIQSYTGNTVAHNAAEIGSEKLLNFLIQSQAKIDMPESSGVTPFMLAVAYGHLELAALFLEAGADINHKDEYHKTAFLHAATGAPLAFIKQLIEKGADPNGEDKSEKGAVQLAIDAQRPDDVIAYIKSVVSDEKVAEDAEKKEEL
jgi:ankyrin repeat protein